MEWGKPRGPQAPGVFSWCDRHDGRDDGSESNKKAKAKTTAADGGRYNGNSRFIGKSYNTVGWVWRGVRGRVAYNGICVVGEVSSAGTREKSHRYAGRRVRKNKSRFLAALGMTGLLSPKCQI
jgi:hypothetical protein